MIETIFWCLLIIAIPVGVVGYYRHREQRDIEEKEGAAAAYQAWVEAGEKNRKFLNKKHLRAYKAVKRKGRTGHYGKSV